MKKAWLSGLAGALMLTLMAPSMAHHSAAAFDRSKPVIITGTVTKYSWQNPHVFVYVVVPDGKGGVQNWALEAGSISIMSRSGWRADSLKLGDKVRVVGAPYIDGTTRAELMSARFEDGRVLSFKAP